MRLPFFTEYTKKCPDGTTRKVHRNVDQILPLFIPGWKADLSGGAKGTASSLGIDSLGANMKGTYAPMVQGLMYAINESNQTIMMQFRAAYLAYTLEPCSNLSFLTRQIEKLNADYNLYSKQRMQVAALVELVKTRPDDTLAIMQAFSVIGGQIGGDPALEATREEIKEARQLADDWVNGNGS